MNRRRLLLWAFAAVPVGVLLSACAPTKSAPPPATPDTTAPAVALTTPADGSFTNDTPHLAGLAGAAAGDSSTVTVMIYAGNTTGGTPIQTVTTTRSGGLWEADASTPLNPDGLYTAQATQSDDAGNVGTSSANTFTVDTNPPAAPTDPNMTEATDSGISDNDDITNDDTPTFTGTAAPDTESGDTTVTILADGTIPLGSGTATGGSYSITTTATTLSEGTHTITATATDAAGNDSPASSPGLSVTIDLTAPAVTLTTPVDDSLINDNTPTLSGAAGVATSPSADIATVSVTVFESDGTTVNQTPTATVTTNTWSATATTLADGTYVAQATQEDEAGNEGTSGPHTFSVDATPPGVTLTTPANNLFTTDTTPALSGAAGDDTGDSSTVTVTIYSGTGTGGAVVQTIPVTRTGATWTTTAAILPQGTYTAQATQTDTALNTGTSTANTFTVDTTAPAAPAAAPDLDAGSDTGTSSTDNVTMDTTPTFTGTVEPFATVAITNGTGPNPPTIGTGTADVSGNYSVTVSPALASDSYANIKARQTDRAGNPSPLSAALDPDLVIDTAGPTVTITAPADGSTTGDNTPNISGTAGKPEAGGDTGILTVKIYSGPNTSGTLLQTLTVNPVPNSGNWTTTAATLAPDGQYTVQASEGDAAGNTGTSTAHTFTVDTGVPSAPSTPDMTSATDSGTSDSDEITQNTTPTFTGTAEAGSTVRIFDGATPVGTGTATGGDYSITTSVLGEGPHSITAKATDAGNNTSPASGALPIVIDTIAPAVTVTAPADGSSTDDDTPALAGAAGNATNDIATVDVTVYESDGTTVNQTPSATVAAATWSATATTLDEDTYVVKATQADAAGNSATTAGNTFTVDTTDPIVTLVNPSDGSTETTATPTLSGTAGQEPGDSTTVTIKIYSGPDTSGTLVDTVTTTAAGGSWSTSANTLIDGQYTAQASQSDSAGNTGESDANTFTVDTPGPNVTLTAPADGSGTSDTTPTFSGTAGDGVNDSATVNVDIYAGTSASGTPVQSLSTTRTGTSWTVDATSALTEGTYTAQANQADNITTSFSNANTFRVDMTGPAVTLTTPADGSSTNDATPTISGAAGDAVGDSNTVTVEIFDDTPTLVETIPVTRTGATWTTTASTLAEGTYTVQATQTDDATNSTTTAANTFTVDTSEPAAPSTPDLDAASDTGSANNDDLTNDTTPTFTGTAEAGSTVTIFVDGTAQGSGVATGGAYSVTTSTLTEDSHTITATATDAAGNESDASGGLPIVIDTTAPAAPSTPDLDAASDTGDLDTDNLTMDTTPTFTGTAVADSTVNILATGGGGNPRGTGTATGGNYNITVSPAIAASTRTYTATATDAAGNPSVASGGLSVTIDTTGPAVSVPDLAAASDTGSTNADNITSNTTPTFTGTADAGRTVTIRVDGVDNNSGVATGGNYSISTTTLSSGTRLITARATDAAGNITTTNALSVTIDTTAPAPTSVTLGGNSGQAGIGDTVTAVFSERLGVNSMCSAWLTTGDNSNQSINGNGEVTVTITENGANDTLTVSSSTCTFNFGSVALGGDYVSATTTFRRQVGGQTNSTIAWTASTNTLVITLGTPQTATTNTGIVAAIPVYTPNAAIKDSAGNLISTTPFNGTSSRF